MDAGTRRRRRWGTSGRHPTGAVEASVVSGVAQRETGEGRRDADMSAPWPQCRVLNQPSQSIQTRSNLFQIISNLIQFKNGLPSLKFLK
jgi:hypothetical protein